MATDRIKTIEEGITIKVELHYHKMVTLMKGVDLSGKSRQVIQGETSGNSAESFCRGHFKPQELDKESEAICNYLTSGGAYADLMVLCMYLKKLFDLSTLIQLDTALAIKF